ncbi:ABC transporter permease [Spirosoma montaniterrae]|uniref:Cell division protein FtsX n=1 Tax=Spirosoma montaniterrae TaxID=1178516 RepID=A0A1P9X0B7_9BACT|nr:ABC transporter permease [Spirosoma montaniterrae]AQG81074.1 hypothetical protein AWR27_18160 [Spirosoma montaniterrae]
MLRNYLKIAWRNLWINRVFSSVNIIGLSLGLAAVLFILLFVRDEISYDKFHEHGDRLYRVVRHTTDADVGERKNGITGMPQGPTFAREIPEVEAFCRVKGYEMLFRKGNEGIYQQVVYADTSFFRLFSFKLLAGDANTLLNDPRSVVLTDEIATKYFGTTDILGKLIKIDAGGNFESYKITGVVKTPPINSSIRFDALRPFIASLPPDRKDWNENVWLNSFLNTFLLLRSDRAGIPADPAVVERKFVAVVNIHARHELADINKEYGPYKLSYHLQPYEAMHLNPEYGMNNGLMSGSSSVYSYILSAIAGFILLLAGINFVNLTLARSLRRGKEIGVRKVIGSTRAQLVGQFLSESLLLTVLAFVPAMLLVWGLLPHFSELANKQLQVRFLFTPQTVGLFLALILLVALLTGLYPALVLSGFSPVQTLYQRFRLSGTGLLTGRNWLGKSLVVVQFTIAVFLLIGTAVLHGQFQYIRTANIGYETANRVRVYIPWGRERRGELLQATLRNQPGIQIVTRKAGGSNFNTYKVNDKPILSAIERIDDQYLSFLDVPVVQGRALTYTNPLDSVSNILVNETFAKKFLNTNQPAVGQIVDQDGGAKTRYTVVGVVRDYQYGTLRDKLEPVLWQLGKPDRMNQLYAKLDPAQTQQALLTIEQNFKRLIPFQPFSVHFMEDDRLENYTDDARWTQIITYSSLLAILISALGLFGLVSLTVETRTKEIGIRKVLGASIAEITRLISVNFLMLVGAACLIAMPVGWYVARQWLDTFVFRMEFDWWIFALTGAFMLIVAGFTIAIQAVRAALMNPVKSLRSE